MATAYMLTLGYNSGYGSDGSEDWPALLSAVNSVNCKELLHEYQGPESCEKGCCSSLEMAEIMTTRPIPDMSIRICVESQLVSLLASGGGVTRAMKEHMRRAFIRCVLRRTDKHGIDIDVSSC